MGPKRIAVLTMVRNDDFYLRKWTAYYGRELGEENLYIYLDGKDQPIPDWCQKATVMAVDKIKGQVVASDKGRIAFLSKRARELLTEENYDLVIGVDADEILVVDPLVGMTLKEYLSQLKVEISVSGLGVDVGQHLEEEEDICGGQAFLQQRKYARLSTRYTKPCVIAKPVVWGSGFHRIKGHNFTIDPSLYLFHFGYFDMKRIEDRFADPDRRQAGWVKHIAKRSKTIQQVTKYKARPWDSTTRLARTLQTCIRPPYAWNKPAMLGLCLIVEIPKRFQQLGV